MFGLDLSVKRRIAPLRTGLGVQPAVLAVAVSVFAGPLAAGAAAAQTLDQSQTQMGALQLSVVGPSPGPFGGTLKGQSVAQTFTAGLSGMLSEVDVHMVQFNADASTPPLTIEIRDSQAGAPGPNVLARASFAGTDVPANPGGWLPVVFVAPAGVQAGTQYTIVAWSDAPYGYYRWHAAYGDPYPSGSPWYTPSSQTGSPTGAWNDHDGDLAFRTYVDTTPTYDFSGFLAPIASDALNVLKAGQGVPVKFSLGGDQGPGVLAAGSPSSRPVACDGSLPSDPVEQTVTAGSSGLTYDTSTGVYTYTWKTDKAWAGACRELTVTLIDGTSHSALFKLSR